MNRLLSRAQQLSLLWDLAGAETPSNARTDVSDALLSQEAFSPYTHFMIVERDYFANR